MSSPKNIHLLKEYIKTFIATEVVFPGIPPRQWGVTFSHSELAAIYNGLNVVIRKVHPLQERAMIAAFEQIDALKPMDLHWFLSDYWREIVAILSIHFTSSGVKGYQFNLNLHSVFDGVHVRAV